jgi:hypothetical protein
MLADGETDAEGLIEGDTEADGDTEGEALEEGDTLPPAATCLKLATDKDQSSFA